MSPERSVSWLSFRPPGPPLLEAFGATWAPETDARFYLYEKPPCAFLPSSSPFFQNDSMMSEESQIKNRARLAAGPGVQVPVGQQLLQLSSVASSGACSIHHAINRAHSSSTFTTSSQPPVKKIAGQKLRMAIARRLTSRTRRIFLNTPGLLLIRLSPL